MLETESPSCLLMPKAFSMTISRRAVGFNPVSCACQRSLSANMGAIKPGCLTLRPAPWPPFNDVLSCVANPQQRW